MRTEIEVAKQLPKKTALIEAALYVSGRPLTVKELGSVSELKSQDKIHGITKHLIEKYESNRSAIQIIKLSDGRYVMQLRPEYIEKVKKLVKRKLISKGPLRTLSFIAYKQPVTQAYIAKVRGKLAYSHIKKLKELGLITEEKLGRTNILKTTITFADYFNLSHDVKIMKKQLFSLFNEIETNQTLREDLYFLTKGKPLNQITTRR